jgi:hypothetical protein
MTPGEIGTGDHGGQDDLTEALAAPRPIEARHGLSQVVDRPMIVTMGLIGLAEVLVRQCLLGDIPIGCGKREGALGGGDGLIQHAPAVEVE